MCNKRSSARITVAAYNGEIRVDDCMKPLIDFLWHNLDLKYQTLACCCGHGKYPMTIVVRSEMGHKTEIISGKKILREKRFYLKDKQGYYYIPEVSKPINTNENK